MRHLCLNLLPRCLPLSSLNLQVSIPGEHRVVITFYRKSSKLCLFVYLYNKHNWSLEEWISHDPWTPGASSRFLLFINILADFFYVSKYSSSKMPKSAFLATSVSISVLIPSYTNRLSFSQATIKDHNGSLLSLSANNCFLIEIVCCSFNWYIA